MYFLSYIVLAALALLALTLGGVFLLVDWLREHRPWERARDEAHDRATPPDPIMRFPSRP
jgi:hypothetical protein